MEASDYEIPNSFLFGTEVNLLVDYAFYLFVFTLAYLYFYSVLLRLKLKRPWPRSILMFYEAV